MERGFLRGEGNAWIEEGAVDDCPNQATNPPSFGRGCLPASLQLPSLPCGHAPGRERCTAEHRVRGKVFSSLSCGRSRRLVVVGEVIGASSLAADPGPRAPRCPPRDLAGPQRQLGRPKLCCRCMLQPPYGGSSSESAPPSDC